MHICIACCGLPSLRCFKILHCAHLYHTLRSPFSKMLHFTCGPLLHPCAVWKRVAQSLCVVGWLWVFFGALASHSSVVCVRSVTAVLLGSLRLVLGPRVVLPVSPVLSPVSPARRTCGFGLLWVVASLGASRPVRQLPEGAGVPRPDCVCSACWACCPRCVCVLRVATLRAVRIVLSFCVHRVSLYHRWWPLPPAFSRPAHLSPSSYYYFF